MNSSDVAEGSPSDVPVTAEKATKKDSSKLPPATTEIMSKKEGFHMKPSLGLIGCLANIAKYFFTGIFKFFVEKLGLNRILGPFGLALEPLIWRGEKRKFSEVEDEDKDNTIDNDDNEEEEKLELEMKRWRPDKVYEAINEFVKRMWGEKDNNDNMKEGSRNDDDSSDENVKWNKKPVINFVARKVVDVQSVGDGDMGHIRDLTPKKTNLDVSGSGDKVIRNKFLLDQVEETIQTSTPLVECKAPEVFVFSADKSTVSTKSTEDLKEDEQSMLSLMTFGEKQIYFAQKIKDEEEAAMKSTPRRSPLPTM